MCAVKAESVNLKWTNFIKPEVKMYFAAPNKRILSPKKKKKPKNNLIKICVLFQTKVRFIFLFSIEHCTHKTILKLHKNKYTKKHLQKRDNFILTYQTYLNENPENKKNIYNSHAP